MIEQSEKERVKTHIHTYNFFAQSESFLTDNFNMFVLRCATYEFTYSYSKRVKPLSPTMLVCVTPRWGDVHVATSVVVSLVKGTYHYPQPASQVCVCMCVCVCVCVYV